MIQKSALTTLSLICLLSWACITGFLMDERIPAPSDCAIVMIGSVKEVSASQISHSLSMTLVSDSQEWSILIPTDSLPPEVGWMVAVSCHTTGSGLMLDNLQVL